MAAPEETNGALGNAVDGKAVRHPLYYVGTLVYSRAGLAWLFTWLLWGDFCFTMMETVVPSIVPLRLGELQAPNWVLGLVILTIPSILNVLMNPLISTASDRHRGRFGRRIPFMLFTVPFVSLALCLLAFSTEIGTWLHGLIGVTTGWSATGTTVVVIAVAMGFFKLSDMFVNTVFWYFFNDVVPQQFMARFLGLFRMVGAGAGALYNYFIYQYALSHLRLIFLCTAGLYLVGFSLMCFFVKEGKYPPLAKLVEGRPNFFLLVRNYAKECLQYPIYRYFFLTYAFWNFSAACGIFAVFQNLSLGLTLQQLGSVAAAVAIPNFILTYPAGVLADRIHPLRVMMWVQAGLLLIAPLNFIWLFTKFTPEINFRIFIALQVVNLPLAMINNAISLPMFMRVLPRSRYGQFCSFNAICGAAATALGGLMAGGFIDFMRTLLPDATWGKDFYYRTIPVWTLPFLGLGMFFLVRLYRTWKQLGGDAHYVPPGSDAEVVVTKPVAVSH